ncbi:Abscission/NoCut checkpoint regulator [Colletotrichum shisoi]|uniref:Abscission/NoCut checkpoint regulator n=1 Tax=Colletotrichum shisoi TaxID=2078593 RepID=A0A5Q4C6E4_9PEZI|nr:Abscission/NoCut checkpoint regulator [Colletotrichum shisoi]
MTSPNDNSLLDRLSALKGGIGSGVSFNRSSNALNVSLTGIESAKPASKEDALAARLRSLRNTPEREESPLTAQPPAAKVIANSRLGRQKTYLTRGEPVSLSSTSPDSARLPHTEPATAAPPQTSSRSPAPALPAVHAESEDDVDPLLRTDDKTLEDLLSDEDLFGVSGPQSRWRFDPKSESAKVNSLLKALSKTSVDQRALSRKGSAGECEGARDAHSDDESDGEVMSREVENLLSQALDDAKLISRSKKLPGPPSPGRSQSPPGHENHRFPQDDNEGDGDGDLGLSLPSVPPTFTAPKADDDGPGGLSLPSVPLGAPKHDAESDFDHDITARMAALGGLGSLSDAMGLPSAPTFQPADRAVKRLTSKTGYTDEDAETWCTVCLDDATLQCLGCEDVYCARCWHEMHVGPAAAFDDRTHKAVRFVKPKKDNQRRVMLGAS